MKNRWTLILSLALLTSGLTIPLTGCKPTRTELAIKVISQLKQERFAELYDESSDMLQRNVAKGEFIRRMKIAVTKLKAIDENLKFERDRKTERMFWEDYETPEFSAYRLKEGDKGVLVIFEWDEDKFHDLRALPSQGTSAGCAVPAVLYQTISREATLADPCP